MLLVFYADYVFSTAHKAKGLEFSSVRVTDDFLMDMTHGMALGVIRPQIDEDFDGMNGIGAVVGAVIGAAVRERNKGKQNSIQVCFLL